MDKSTLRHRMTVAPFDEWSFHGFVRSDDGTVEHYYPHPDGDPLIFGSEDLGGSWDTDPIATGLFSGGVGELHLIGRSGSQLVDWVWENAGGRPGMLGAPRVVPLPGFAVADPEVIGTAGRIDVFAPSLDGPLRHWFLLSPEEGWQGPELMTGVIADVRTRPCAVSRAPGVFDVFTISNDNSGLHHWFNGDQGWQSEPRSSTAAGQDLVGRPTAVSYEEQRLDVFALRRDGVPVHWGWDGRRWFDQELGRLEESGVLLNDLTLLTTEPKRMTLVAREPAAAGTEVVFWDLEPGPPAFWRKTRWTGSPFPMTAWRAREQAWSLLTRRDDGSFGYDLFERDDSLIVGGNQVEWSITESGFERTDPVPSESFVPAVVEPTLVARRPEDLVLLGVEWNDSLEVVSGPPAELLAHEGAELSLTLPPQHVAEEVVADQGPSRPPSTRSSPGESRCGAPPRRVPAGSS
jgi:hypothetical protein